MKGSFLMDDSLITTSLLWKDAVEGENPDFALKNFGWGVVTLAELLGTGVVAIKNMREKVGYIL